MTVESHPRGFKIRTIIDCLAWDLLLILSDTLTQDSVDSDRLKLRILMTLSDVPDRKQEVAQGVKPRSFINSFVNKLLFRDYSVSTESVWHRFDLPETDESCARTVKIHDEAITYLFGVLERRLTLAQNLKDQPTNMHLLFECFSRFSQSHPIWNSVQIIRTIADTPPQQDTAYFRGCAQRLAEKRQILGTNFSEISQRRRKQYGPIWLVVGDCAAEIPEELSLFDVIDALPLSLKPEFLDEAKLQKCFIRVLDSLNERYKLLRSCGLKPQIWLGRNSPSIAVLRELKQLRTEAEKYLKTGKVTNMSLAYRQIFDNKLTLENHKKYAGSTTFDEFTRTEHGMAVLHYSTISLDQSTLNGSGNEELSLYDAIADSDFDEDAIGTTLSKFNDDFEWLQYLIDSRPELFDEVMIVFFHQAIGTCQALDGDANDCPLLKDREFRALLKANSLYRNLTDDELVERLVQQAERIIDLGLQTCTNTDRSCKTTSEADNDRQKTI